VKALDDSLLDEYIDFNKCLAMGTTADVVHHLQTYHRYMAGSVDWPLLTVDLEKLTSSFRGKPMEEIELGKIIGDMFAIGRKHGIRPRAEMALLMVAGVTSEGVAKMINPKADSFGDIAAFLMPIIAARGLTTPSLLACSSENRDQIRNRRGFEPPRRQERQGRENREIRSEI
jgi:predicted unusual protein kinase regulating ubiquinone biosynthesis (AarF/ABC1/UbiB family)